MRNVIRILILLFVLPNISLGQDNQVIKGRSTIKKLKYSNEKAVKIKRVTSDIKVDSLAFIDLNKNNILEFGEEGLIRFLISNNSDDTLKNMQVVVDGGNSKKIIFPSKSTIDKIVPKSILELTLPIKNVNSDTLIDSDINLSISLISDKVLVFEDNLDLMVGKKGEPQLDISYNYALNSDTIIDNIEEPVNYVRLNLAIKNDSDFSIFKVSGVFKLKYIGGYIISDEEVYDYDFISSGEVKEIELKLIISSDFSQEKYPVNFEITGNSKMYKHTEKIDVEL